MKVRTRGNLNVKKTKKLFKYEKYFFNYSRKEHQKFGH